MRDRAGGRLPLFVAGWSRGLPQPLCLRNHTLATSLARRHPAAVRALPCSRGVRRGRDLHGGPRRPHHLSRGWPHPVAPQVPAPSRPAAPLSRCRRAAMHRDCCMGASVFARLGPSCAALRHLCNPATQPHPTGICAGCSRSCWPLPGPPAARRSFPSTCRPWATTSTRRPWSDRVSDCVHGGSEATGGRGACRCAAERSGRGACRAFLAATRSSHALTLEHLALFCYFFHALHSALRSPVLAVFKHAL